MFLCPVLIAEDHFTESYFAANVARIAYLHVFVFERPKCRYGVHSINKIPHVEDCVLCITIRVQKIRLENKVRFFIIFIQHELG